MKKLRFLLHSSAAALRAANYGGIGRFWCEPAVGGGRGCFDKDGNAVPVLTVFDKFTRH
jgi:hypothetical protein